MRDWAVRQARAGCYSQAAFSSNDSKTLYTIVKSGDIRRGLLAQGHKYVPVSGPGIIALVSKYATEVKEGKAALIKEKLAHSLKFSVTTDDYTKALQPKRFACINLHLEGQHHQVALFRIKGSHPAEKAVELLKKKFNDLDINVKETSLQSVLMEQK